MHGVVALLVLGVAAQANAQQASEQAQKACRDLTNKTAKLAVEARQKGIRAVEIVDRPAESWIGGVQNHIFHAAERSPSSTQRELATIGYAYCIERRPKGL
jgi:hypothetical protein